jgi:hypothetical protein
MCAPQLKKKIYLFCLAQARSSKENKLQCIEFFTGVLLKAACKALRGFLLHFLHIARVPDIFMRTI